MQGQMSIYLIHSTSQNMLSTDPLLLLTTSKMMYIVTGWGIKLIHLLLLYSATLWWIKIFTGKFVEETWILIIQDNIY